MTVTMLDGKYFTDPIPSQTVPVEIEILANQVELASQTQDGTETSSSDSNSEQTSDDIIVDEIDEISFEEVDPSNEVIDYYWTTVQSTSNWERPDVEPL